MNHTTRRHDFKAIASLVAAILTVPIGILWAWNMALPEIFGAPAIDYRNALGLVLLGLVVTAPFLRGRRQRRHAKGGESGRA